MYDDYDLDGCLNILEINQACDEKFLKSCYRKMIKKYHPDKYHNSPDILKSVTQKAIKINEAYNYLKKYIELNGPIIILEQEDEPEEDFVFEDNEVGFTAGFPESGVFEYFVHSSNIFSCGYSPEKNFLYLKFRNSYAVYRYYDVEEHIFFDLMDAESHGKYVNKNIAYSFRYEKCTEKNIPYTGPKNILIS